MKNQLIIILFSTLSCIALGQNINFETPSDTQQIKQERELQRATNGPLMIYPSTCGLIAESTSFGYPTMVIDNDSLFAIWKKAGIECEKPDFSKQLLLTGTYRGDCHMQLEHHPTYDPITNTLILTTYNIWGGCRAGGHQSFAILIEKPSEAFTVLYLERQVEGREEYSQLTNQRQLRRHQE